MSLLIDREYISLLSSRLEGFAQKNNGVFNCRCPLCGDSEKSTRKKRLYFYTKKDLYFVRCHNCGHSSRFVTFLKIIDIELFKEYSLALFKETDKYDKKEKDAEQHAKIIAEQKKIEAMTVGIDYTNLKRFEHLPEDHPARVYVSERGLPLDRILYAPNFRDWLRIIEIDQYLKDRFDHLTAPMIVIPFWLKSKHSRVFQIRTFDPNFKPKYLTFKMDPDDLKIFGVERINPHKMVFILEGPFDSMGLPNSVAFSGTSSELPENIKSIKKKAFFLDNEPRNKDVVKQIQKIINMREKVVILPDTYARYKDVNDFVKAGINPEPIFKKHVYQGAIAQMKFDRWKRIKTKRKRKRHER